MKCRICGNGTRTFLNLGKTPLANAFLRREDLDKEEPTFPLEVCFCTGCALVQLTEVIPPEKLFRNYVYVSSTTKSFQEHFARMAEELTRMMGTPTLAVDIGSNDGILLKGFRERGVRVVGVEPATNIAKIANDAGIETINDFFNADVTKRIVALKGRADVVTATNVFAHVGDIQGFTANVRTLLKDDGIFVIEVQYVGDMLTKMTFDNVYHEHLSYFSASVLVEFFKRFGMEVFRVKRVDTHGGSLRVYVQKKGSGRFPIDASVKEIIEEEKGLGATGLQAYVDFARKVEGVRTDLVKMVTALRKDGRRVAAYGAPAKGSTLLNFCGIGADAIQYTVDDSPLKQGLFMPGTHIPVLSSKALDERRPDYIMILAWNFAPEIMEKIKKHRDAGVKCIVPLPEPTII